jgi:gluconolactonase
VSPRHHVGGRASLPLTLVRAKREGRRTARGEINVRVMASGLKFPEGPVALSDGSVLVVEIHGGTVARVLPDGTVTRLATLGGGPNGAALGPDGALYVCNNGGYIWTEGPRDAPPARAISYVGGRIERVDIDTGQTTLLYTECGGRKLSAPNDIVFDRSGGFYFTDLGKSFPDHVVHGAVFYALPDGSQIQEVAFPLVRPNGLGLSPDEKTLYVAEMVTGRLWAFDIAEPGRLATVPTYTSPHGGRFVCGLGGLQKFDSLALDREGNICVATLLTGAITVISPSGQVLRQIETTDPVTTNICFGGADMRTAYITLGSRGELCEMEWPSPGLRLNFSR